MTSKQMRSIVDPVGAACGSGWCDHLKQIAAIQLLDNINPDELDTQAIDKAFGIDVQQVANFAYLDGGIFKE